MPNQYPTCKLITQSGLMVTGQKCHMSITTQIPNIQIAKGDPAPVVACCTIVNTLYGCEYLTTCAATAHE